MSSDAPNSPADWFARNIKKLRGKHDWSQQELANRSHYSRTYIGKLERGQKAPSLEALTRIARAFDLELATIISSQCRNTSTETATNMYLTGTLDETANILDCALNPPENNLSFFDSGMSFWALPFFTTPAFITLREPFMAALNGTSTRAELSNSKDGEPDCDLILTPLPDWEYDDRVSFTIIWPHHDVYDDWEYDEVSIEQ